MVKIYAETGLEIGRVSSRFPDRLYFGV